MTIGVRRVLGDGGASRVAGGLALAAALICTGCTTAPMASPPAPTTIAASPTASASLPPTASASLRPTLAATDPTRVVIPALDLDEPLIDLGLSADGSMEVPQDFAEVGWFTGGGRPGGTGPTVIAAHVDSPTGPAVFQRLREVVVGDVVEVFGADGSVHTYRVVETADFPKSEFPTARVFGATARDELRVITCGGVFDRAAGSYVDNRVVFAERV